jgi:signal transduction histidine kinase
LRERVHIDCPPELTVCTDPDQLSAILINLAGNAVKYAPTGPIRLRARAAANGGCAIEVQDEGPGIPRERLPRLFDAFDRAGSARAGGFGLGLYIARRAADLLGATLDVESEVGRGTTFCLGLPALPPGRSSRGEGDMFRE